MHFPSKSDLHPPPPLPETRHSTSCQANTVRPGHQELAQLVLFSEPTPMGPDCRQLLFTCNLIRCTSEASGVPLTTLQPQQCCRTFQRSSMRPACLIGGWLCPLLHPCHGARISSKHNAPFRLQLSLGRSVIGAFPGTGCRPADGCGHVMAPTQPHFALQATVQFRKYSLMVQLASPSTCWRFLPANRLVCTASNCPKSSEPTRTL